MTIIQTIITAPFHLLGWTWATAKRGWGMGIASASDKPKRFQITRILTPNKLDAIKALRSAIEGLGLKESKDACDRVCLGTPFVLPEVIHNPGALKGVFEIKQV